jgi:hypothetical protein
VTTPSAPPGGPFERVLAGTLLCDVAELLQHVRAALPPLLREAIPSAAIQTAARPLPAVAGVGAFECRLDDTGGVAGFEALVRVADGGRDALERSGGASHRFGMDAAWARVSRFFAAWCDPASPLHAVPAVWVEFDVEGSIVRSPFVVYRVPPDLPSAHLLERIVHAGLDPAGATIDAHTRGNLDRCFARLHVGGRLLHVARRPLGDGDDVVRLIVLARWRDVPSWLGDVGWRGDAASLSRWLERSCVDQVAVSMHCDVGATIGSQVGVEYHFPTAPDADPRWMRLLDLLEAEGACTAAWRRTLCEWVTPSARDAQPSLWPPRLQRSVLIKVVHDAKRPIRAKAYLAFQPRLALS